MAKTEVLSPAPAAPPPAAAAPAAPAAVEPAAAPQAAAAAPAAPAATQAAPPAPAEPRQPEGLTVEKLGVGIDETLQEGASEEPPLTIAGVLHRLAESGLPDPHGAACGHAAFAINTGLITSTAKEFFEQSTGEVIAKTLFDLVATKRATQLQVTEYLRRKFPERRVAPSSSL